METLTISLPDDLKDDLQKPGEELSKPVGDIVRESIRRCVAVEEFLALRKKTLPFAEAQGYLTDEDVFDAISRRLFWIPASSSRPSPLAGCASRSSRSA